MAKTNPTSIRFDSDKFDFVKGTEKLGTAQKVVDFLLDKYWWEKKVGQAPATTQNKTDSDHISQNVVNTATRIEVPKISQFEAYCVEIKNAASIDSVRQIVRTAKVDSDLSPTEKIKIEQFGIQQSRNFDF